MPKQKDLKRLVRSRMEKTGEAYTAARAQLLKKNEPAANYAELGGMSDASVRKATGRTWAQWVGVLDRAGAAEKPHRDIAKHLFSLGVPSWWSQMVTVGYERIRGLRARGQRRGGGYSASKSRTFNVSAATLFQAFFSARRRGKWLPVKIALRSATPHKRMRVTWDDGSIAVFEFTSKGKAKSSVAVGHLNLPDKPAADALKKTWAGYFDRLGQFLG